MFQTVFNYILIFGISHVHLSWNLRNAELDLRDIILNIIMTLNHT